MSLLLRDRIVPRRPSLDGVLDFAWARAAFTAADVMEAVGLARSTAIEAIDDLVRLGFVSELPSAREVGDYTKGRPARRFAFCAEAAVVVGIDAGRAHVVTTVADLRGAALVRRTDAADLPRADSSQARRALVSGALDAALAAVGRTREDVLGICVGVPAPVDRHGRSPAHREDFWLHMNPDLLGLFSWAPIVRIENDACLASVAEHSIGAAQGLRDSVTLLAGERIGAGVVVDGNLLRGAHGGVGEVVSLAKLQGVGQVHGLGFLVAQWAQAAVADGAVAPDSRLRELPVDQLTSKHVFEAARNGDADAQRIVDQAGAQLAVLSGVFGSLYDPQRIIVSGAVSDGMDEVIAIASRLLPTEMDLPAPQLVASTLGADVVSIGAVNAALEVARQRALYIDP